MHRLGGGELNKNNAKRKVKLQGVLQGQNGNLYQEKLYQDENFLFSTI